MWWKRSPKSIRLNSLLYDFYNDRKARGLAVERNIFTNSFGNYEEVNFMNRYNDIASVRCNKFVLKKISIEEMIEIDRIHDKKIRMYYEIWKDIKA